MAKTKNIRVKFNELLTGNRKDKKKLGVKAVNKQRLASTMAWQTLHYPDDAIKKERLTRASNRDSWKLYKNLRGVMLADEVGGGKTYEALAIISKFYLEKYQFEFDRRKIEKRKKLKLNKKFRVLILANSSIQIKWKWDNECFNEDTKIITDPEKCDYSRFIYQTDFKKNISEKIRVLTGLFCKQENCNRNTWKKWSREENNGIWLGSFNTLPQAKYSRKKGKYQFTSRFPVNAFDFIIIDEAHVAKSSVAAEDVQSNLNKTTNRKVQALFNCNSKAKVILLTATPFQNGLNDLLFMLDLLEKDTVRKDETIVKILKMNLKKANAKMQELISNLENENIKDNIEELKSLLNKEIENIKEPYSTKELKYQKHGLNDLLRKMVVRNNKKPVTINPVDVLLNPLEELQYFMLRSLVPIREDEDEKEMYATKLSQLVSSGNAFSKKFRNDKRTKDKNINKGLEYQRIIKLFDNQNLISKRKIEKTINIIEERRKEIAKQKNSKKVITIFFRFIPSIVEFRDRIRGKYKYEIISGSLLPAEYKYEQAKVKPKDRFNLLSKLKNEAKANTLKDVKLLLISQVGNEGLDFDDFCDTIIHYDGHYNPAVIDQRNGRIYRGNNIDNPDNLNIYQVFIQDSYDARIKFIMEEKKQFKDFFLGTKSLDKIIYDEQEGKIKQEDDLIKNLKDIKVDLNPMPKYLLKKYQNEIAE